jgi:mannose-6-phosphate isomerase-like protein (cupin superfamily)
VATEQATKGYVVRAGTGVAGYGPEVKASRASTGGTLTVIESRIGGGPPLHVHTHEDESFYVLDGSLTVRCGDDLFAAGPGSFVFLPRGLPHTFTPDGDLARVLFIGVPGGIEEYFGEINQATDLTAQRQVAGKYGIHVVEAPLPGTGGNAQWRRVNVPPVSR